MKWRGCIMAVGVLGTLLFVFFQPQGDKPPVRLPENKPDAEFTADDRTPSAETQILRRMTLEEKIGQLIIAGLYGTELTRETKSFIQNYKPAGFNLLARNVKTSAQSKKFIADIKETYRRSGLLEPFIAADQEGGTYVRFRFLEERTSQSAIQNEAEAKAVAKRRALELKQLGVNVVFSPILDYVTDPESYLYVRSFQKTPMDIIRFGGAMIEGYRKEGIIPVPKHFPGYGNLKTDPHKTPASSKEKGVLEKSLDIFEKIIASTSPEMLMTAHVVTSLDTEAATFSQKILVDILRKKIGYKGIIISDDLEMAAALGNKSIGEQAVRAILAGNDLLISTTHPEKVPPIMNAIKGAVRDGRIPEAMIDEKVLKIISLKSKIPR